MSVKVLKNKHTCKYNNGFYNTDNILDDEICPALCDQEKFCWQKCNIKNYGKKTLILLLQIHVCTTCIDFDACCKKNFFYHLTITAHRYKLHAICV